MFVCHFSLDVFKTHTHPSNVYILFCHNIMHVYFVWFPNEKTTLPLHVQLIAQELAGSYFFLILKTAAIRRGRNICCCCYKRTTESICAHSGC